MLFSQGVGWGTAALITRHSQAVSAVEAWAADPHIPPSFVCPCCAPSFSAAPSCLRTGRTGSQSFAAKTTCLWGGCRGKGGWVTPNGAAGHRAGQSDSVVPPRPMKGLVSWLTTCQHYASLPCQPAGLTFHSVVICRREELADKTRLNGGDTKAQVDLLSVCAWLIRGECVPEEVPTIAAYAYRSALLTCMRS